MTSLQEKSNKMNTSLNNKKKIQGLLNSFIESAVLDKELIDAICLGEINDNYVNHIKALLKKLSYLNSNLIAPDSKAVKELQPEL
jgi:HPt (histidine-containing phosphotransfer) domain-containing protein